MPRSHHYAKRSISRRDFLKLSSAASAALALAACGLNPNEVASPTPSATPLLSATPLPPTATSTAAPSATATPDYRSWVAIGKAATYQPEILRPALETMLAGLGGLDKLVKNGARVGIKVNLTGGTWWDAPEKPPSNEFFATHPAVVGILGELLRDLGASRLFVMDGVGDENNFPKWGYTEMAAPLNMEIVNLSKPDPHPGYARTLVGSQALVYDHFFFNPTLNELDVFISIGKMKTHSVGGVTLAMKNLFGLVPIEMYRRAENDNHRSMFHESTDYDPRLSKIIVDLNIARPIHLAIIDGIMTADRGAGPWDKELTQVKPGILVAGTDVVATDAVAAAVMGFDPAAPSQVEPFLHCDNYLSIARATGLGTNLLTEIGVVGETIDNARFPFHLPA